MPSKTRSLLWYSLCIHWVNTWSMGLYGMHWWGASASCSGQEPIHPIIPNTSGTQTQAFLYAHLPRSNPCSTWTTQRLGMPRALTAIMGVTGRAMAPIKAGMVATEVDTAAPTGAADRCVTARHCIKQQVLCGSHSSCSNRGRLACHCSNTAVPGSRYACLACATSNLCDI
jgi:hypothetical protein